MFAGCGETVKGAVEGQPGTGQGEGGVSADTLNRVMPSDQLLDYSMDEDDADRREITPEEADKLLNAMDVEAGGNGKAQDEVFLSKEEEERKAMDEEKEKEAKAKAARRAEACKRREEAEKRKEDARMAGEAGRDLGTKQVRSKIDNRYFVVRSIRAAKQVGRDLNKEADQTVEEGVAKGFLGEDERWLRNYNIHSVERGLNVSCSFNPRSGLCYTCLGGTHRAWESRDGTPVVVVLADQAFPANVPAADGGECMRVVRVEDGNLQELVAELTTLARGKKILPGTVVMLGSMTQLARYGTAWYAGEWLKARNTLKSELGEVLVVPLLPLVSEDLWGRNLVRSLVEFLSWYDDLQDPEVELLRGVRRQYLEDFFSKVEGGEPWADILQNLMLPVSLYGEGLMLYKSRGWGSLPMFIRLVDEHEEGVWVGKIGMAMIREVNVSLATTMCLGRTLSAVRSFEEKGGKLCFKVAGASNAARTAAALARKGMDAEKVGQRGWSLAVKKDVVDLTGELRSKDLAGEVLVFHCMDNGTFFSMEGHGGSTLPKKISGKYHIPGKLVVASGYALELMVEKMADMAKEVKPGMVVVITPMPRYLDACCEEHNKGRSEEKQEEDREKLVKACWNLKRETYQLLTKMHCKNFVVISPMEVLNVKDSVAGVRKVMSDGIHLDRPALDLVADHVIQKAEEHFVMKKRGPTERAGTAEKKQRFSSSTFEFGRGGKGYTGSSFDFGRGGRGGRFGRGGGMGGRAHSAYNQY